MKKTFRFLSLTLLAIGAFIATPSTTHAWIDTPYTIPYTVNGGAGQGPSVYAGPDQTWTLPISTATLAGNATDPDGTIVTTVWTFQSGPITPTIATPSALSTGVSAMNLAGTYVFTLSAQDDSGNWASDQMQIVITSIAGPSGTLSASSCGIATGASTCSSTVGWTTTNLTAAATVITRDTGSPASFVPAPLESGSQSATLAYGTTTFSLEHNDVLLAQASASAACLSVIANWNGSMCVEGGSPVNGMCGASHWDCSQGTSDAQTGSGVGPWTWSCLGSNGGSNDFCTETGGGGSFQCSDTIDNDGDGLKDFPNDPGCTGPTDDDETNGGGGGGGGFECSDGVDNADADILVDTLDPGCHSDGNAGNVASYDPNDDNETNKRKPIFIEF